MPGPQTILILDASSLTPHARAAMLISQDQSLTTHIMREEAGHDGIAHLPQLAAACLEEITPDLIAVLTGPGSFTGLRTSCALAEGLALGTGCDVTGLSRGEALAEALHAQAQDNGLDGWICLSTARQGRWFIEGASLRDGPLTPEASPAGTWEPPPGRWFIAGDADGNDLTTRFPGRITLSGRTAPEPQEIARAALTKYDSGDRTRPVLPLYIDPPEAKLPAGGLRPRPV
ncbi:tRNA (adenosine(37)-N6)-threonylcarbamoyltransferase complex dimerization subunit type 1 TsaB [Acetobacter sp. AN02]|uniref:tRNA (adenosine(37)-N6)-threonylcarbamoyltransferase complex dimerization subunit type 1 TsaB n=1 Tax=Acetobacter sp. AN02 TaxID=2894186 RepID=UPI002434189A|nr:tRNA (adenosine(37)-N6)-threonylcarbamoyltransferase complex dimerization subunit type 1 TsaB [Acetobacter sp. AN02]MDG6093583.1 tRNA (adenosine(37)-N6)-threonylcarbamoyltransferase complex dimerization subunit type 1 TsaB [Acetobacter sp. AN02]